MITLGIPTYNRAEKWMNGVLLGSILNQTRKPDEVIIVDDNSTDDTPTVLKEIKRQLEANKIPTKLFRTTEPKRAKRQASALPDNVIFNECSSDILVHIDDDGWMDKTFIWENEKLQNEKKACYYSEIVFIDEKTNTQLPRDDSRLPRIKDGGVRVHLTKEDCWGASYSCPIWFLHGVGGCNMDNFWMLGADSRLGCQLYNFGCDTIFTREAKFFHYDLSHFQKQKLNNEEVTNRLSVNVGNYNETIVNGGCSFFLENKMKKLYETI